MDDFSSPIVPTLSLTRVCPTGYSREIPFGCVDEGLLSVLYFLPGQAMRPHRHLDSDEYFTAVRGDAEMLVDGSLVMLPQGHTFLRRRGVLHALRNAGPGVLVVQSFQSPIPREERIVWEGVECWMNHGINCPRCWCGQRDDGDRCINCGLRYTREADMPEALSG